MGLTKTRDETESKQHQPPKTHMHTHTRTPGAVVVVRHLVEVQLLEAGRQHRHDLPREDTAPLLCVWE